MILEYQIKERQPYIKQALLIDMDERMAYFTTPFPNEEMRTVGHFIQRMLDRGATGELFERNGYATIY